jgi:hypothetical protein
LLFSEIEPAAEDLDISTDHPKSNKGIVSIFNFIFAILKYRWLWADLNYVYSYNRTYKLLMSQINWVASISCV